MKIPHIKDMFKDGNPGFKPRFKLGVGHDEIGCAIVHCLFYAAIIWFIINLIWL